VRRFSAKSRILASILIRRDRGSLAARGLSFDAIFIPGLAEKMFPSKIVEEPILLDAVRKRISADLVTNQTRLDRERLALSLAAGAAEQRILVGDQSNDALTVRSRYDFSGICQTTRQPVDP
jgi:inactivated superfamily I helicase